MPLFPTRFSVLVCACAGLLTAMPTLAHQTVSTGWCSVNNAQIEIVGTFNYGGQELSNYSVGRIARDLLTWEPCYDTNGCGIVDQWHWASQRAAEYCRSLVNTGQRDALQPIPVIDGPTSYFGDKHHKYKFDDGLTGVCAVCYEGSEITD